MNEYKQKTNENTERQKDNTQDSEGFHPIFNELRLTNNEQGTKRQRDRKEER